MICLILKILAFAFAFGIAQSQKLHFKCMCGDKIGENSQRHLRVELSSIELQDERLCPEFCVRVQQWGQRRGKRQIRYGVPTFRIPYFHYQPRYNPPQFATRRRVILKYNYDCLEQCAPYCTWDCERGVNAHHGFNSIPLALAQRYGFPQNGRSDIRNLAPAYARQVENGRRRNFLYGGLPPPNLGSNIPPPPLSANYGFKLPSKNTSQTTATSNNKKAVNSPIGGTIVQPIPLAKIATEEKKEEILDPTLKTDFQFRSLDNATTPLPHKTTTAKSKELTTAKQKESTIPNKGETRPFTAEALKEPKSYISQKSKARSGEEFFARIPPEFRTQRRRYKLYPTASTRKTFDTRRSYAPSTKLPYPLSTTKLTSSAATKRQTLPPVWDPPNKIEIAGPQRGNYIQISG